MSEPVLQATDLVIDYPVRAGAPRSLKDHFVGRSRGTEHRGYYRALSGVSLTLQAGESVGLIGRNGSGKTTLLRVLAGCLAPTLGHVTTRGRVVPIIDLWAGFDPELSGLEATRLRGLTMGHKPREINKRLDAILGFAELHAFADAPVRTYSQGMVARLAFAVATEWQADVFLVDEVLAVGDETFQPRCYSRLATLRAQGAAFVLASHDRAALLASCDTCLRLEGGRVAVAGPAGALLGSTA